MYFWIESCQRIWFIFRCIHQKEFYKDFKDSDVYKNYYQFDEGFQVVDDLLEEALNKNPARRNFRKYLCETSDGWVFDKFKTDDELLKVELSKLCSKFE